MGFNIVLGGYMSIKRVAESIDMNVWVPATVEAAVELTTAILRVFRDEGDRGDRQKARLMWLIEKYGEVTEVDGHPRCSEAYRQKIIDEMKASAPPPPVPHTSSNSCAAQQQRARPRTPRRPNAPPSGLAPPLFPRRRRQDPGEAGRGAAKGHHAL
jgi:sulfite reductase beta subunit-like hemoprotein